MVILWLTNIPLSIYCETKNIVGSCFGGWLDKMSRQLSLNHRLISVYPAEVNNEESVGSNSYYSFHRSANNVQYFESIIRKEHPDIIHIWGTEFRYSYEMVSASNNENMGGKTVLSIQGSSYYYGKNHYYANLPPEIITGYSFRDFLKRNNILAEKKAFDIRGKWEVMAIKNAKSVIGRTTWDKAITHIINSEIKYYHCNETLREPFYGQKWELKNCTKHRIFMSQGQYPLKGLHMAIEALEILKRTYSDAMLYVAGINMVDIPFYKRTNYQSYIIKLIRKNGLENNVNFLGNLNGSEMAEQLKCSHVYVNASSIENSSNSLGEAMLVGCPCVASNVGGTADMINDKEEGFLFPFNEPYMLAYYIEKIFESDELALDISRKAHAHALKTHDPENNFNDLIHIYKSLNCN